MDTDITDAEITELITESDAFINVLTPYGSLSATILQMLSKLYTAYRCMMKDPNSRKIGDYSEDRATTMKLMKAEFDGLVTVFNGGISFKAASESLA